jgi:hypothetical protein
MIIAVPSKGRAGPVRTQAVISSCSVYLPDLEAETYHLGSVSNRPIANPRRSPAAANYRATIL